MAFKKCIKFDLHTEARTTWRDLKLHSLYYSENLMLIKTERKQNKLYKIKYPDTLK